MKQQPCPQCGHWTIEPVCPACSYVRTNLGAIFMGSSPVMHAETLAARDPETGPTVRRVRTIDQLMVRDQ